MSRDVLADLPASCRVDGGKAHLARRDPGKVAHGLDKERAAALLAGSVERLARLQVVLAAAAERSLLVVLQAMDAGGKDGTIRHVMSGVNPQGVRVTSFKQPGGVELQQDFLRRVHAAVPLRGEIGLFNRSHYEDVLVGRVHPDRLDPALRKRAGHDRFWDDRLSDIVAFESYLARQGVTIVKVFLHISKDEQRRRFLSRIDHPDKLWKLSAADIVERERWDDYQRAYEAAISATATKKAPWFVVPADHKWFARLVVVETIVQALEGMDLAFPEPDPEEVGRLREAQASLEE
ncbi:MAG: PPK2 family polyphosphate kinase [Janthinobacterium lividum]